jgi:hypothetical protein
MDFDNRRWARGALALNKNARREPGAEKAIANCRAEFTRSRGRAKSLIVRAALSGLLPVELADWLIRQGGLRDA